MVREKVKLRVGDVSGQKQVRFTVPADTTVQTMLEAAIAQLRIPASDVDGRPLEWQARLGGDEERYLHPSEVLGDLQRDKVEEHTVTLVPQIEAGAK